MAPIISNIISDMATKIDAMTDSTYNLNWGQTNEFDRAVINWRKYDATARIRPADTGEQNDDFEGGAHGCAYRNRFDLELWIDVPLTAASNNANYDILERFYLAVDDIKQCFADANVNDYYVQYDSWRPVYSDDNGDNFFPRRIIINMHTWYTQDRDDPEQAGDA